MRIGTMALLSIFAVAAQAVEPCRYTVNRPEAFLRGFRSTLVDIGISALPPSLKVPGFPEGRSPLLRGAGLVGQLSYTEDVRQGTATAVVSDPVATPLFEVTERKFVCGPEAPVGLCREIRAYTDLQRPMNGLFPFLITLGPKDTPRYYRYAAEVDYATFEKDYHDAFSWLTKTLSATPHLLAPPAKTPEERVFWALAADPLIAPYLSRLRLYQGPVYFVISGVVPSNQIYSLILMRALAAGFLHVDPRMVIDTRTRLPLEEPLIAEGCFPG